MSIRTIHSSIERIEREIADLEKRAAKSETPKDRLTALCKTYRHALRSSDKICLCGLLGAEKSGLPEKLGRAVVAFFEANIRWVVKALPADMPAKRRQAKAVQIIATLQGAMMLATCLKNPKLFDAAANEILADFEA